MAEIELRKELVGKVSKVESFDFTITLKDNRSQPVPNYTLYSDTDHPENNITTNEQGVATVNGVPIVTFVLGEGETSKSVTLNVPEGTKLTVAETAVKKLVNGQQKEIYNTSYSINGGTAKTGTASISVDSDSSQSIVFTNNRKMQTIT